MASSSDYGELPTDLELPESDAFPPSTHDFYSPPPSDPPIPFSEALEAIQEVRKEAIEKKVKEGKVILFETKWPNHGNVEELKTLETPTRPSVKRMTRSGTPTHVEREIPDSMLSSPTGRTRQELTTPQKTPTLESPKLKIELTTSPFPSSPPTPLLSHPRPNRRLAEQFKSLVTPTRRGPKRKPPEKDCLEDIKKLPEFADDMKVAPRKRTKVGKADEDREKLP